MNKNPKIQVLRAIAIITVVLIHTCKGGYEQVYFRPFVNYGVALFIFLSGYLTKTENANWRIFMIKRITRVMIPYIIWSIVYTLPCTDFGTYVYNLVTTRACPILYYIFVYVQFVLLTPLLGKLARSRYRGVGFFVAPVTIILYKYLGIIFNWHPHGYLDLLWSFSCCAWFSYYYLGLLCGNGLLQVRFNRGALVLLCGVSLILQIVEGFIFYKYLNDYNCGSQVKISALLSNMIILLFVDRYLGDETNLVKNAVLELVGDYSFGIYLCHVLLMKAIISFWPIFNKLPLGVNSIIILLISCFTVFAGRKALGERVSRLIGFV